MTATMPVLDNMTFDITEEMQVRASTKDTFAALLAELGPENLSYPGGDISKPVPMPMVLEAWPGGRWFRDLGNNAGHLWGHVQAIKPPTLLEISGPLMMSFAAANNIQYRLKEERGGTVISFRHTAIALFPAEYREHMAEGWSILADRIRRRLEKA
jgi:hypothetical protein